MYIWQIIDLSSSGFLIFPVQNDTLLSIPTTTSVYKYYVACLKLRVKIRILSSFLLLRHIIFWEAAKPTQFYNFIFTQEEFPKSLKLTLDWLLQNLQINKIWLTSLRISLPKLSLLPRIWLDWSYFWFDWKLKWLNLHIRVYIHQWLVTKTLLKWQLISPFQSTYISH